MSGREVAFSNRGLAIDLSGSDLSIACRDGIFAPPPEKRGLDAIRGSLLDPSSAGPDPVYSIWMDVGRDEHREDLRGRYLLFGLVRYAAGLVGEEPVRSQGHVHAIAAHSGWSPPELIEVWEGKAILYLQEQSGDDPGRCFAVEAEAGEMVVVPPGWAHCMINADPARTMTFLALCDRQYGFLYEPVRARKGLAWYPVWDGTRVRWRSNPNYQPSRLAVGSTRQLSELSVQQDVPLYSQFAQAPDELQWVSQPALTLQAWQDFNPLDVVRELYPSART